MKQLSLEKEKILVSYTGDSMPESVRNFMPDVYRDGESYTCISGTGSNAITGQGATIEDAMKDWDNAYRSRQETQRQG
ncbi:hypothetical protein ACX0G7_08585 [Flavitalea antarctica]